MTAKVIISVKTIDLLNINWLLVITYTSYNSMACSLPYGFFIAAFLYQ